MTALSICTTIQAQLAAKRDVISLSPAMAEETLGLLNNLVERALHESGFGAQLNCAPGIDDVYRKSIDGALDRMLGQQQAGVPVEEGEYYHGDPPEARGVAVEDPVLEETGSARLLPEVRP